MISPRVRSPLLMLLAVLGAGCAGGAHRREQVRAANPTQFDELTMVSPTCARPEKEDVATCEEAALLLSLPPPEATQRFLQFWSACGRAERDRRKTQEIGERANLRGQSGFALFDLVFSVVNLAGTVAERKAIKARGRFEDQGTIVVPVLRHVYARSDLSYAEAMHRALEDVRWTSYDSYVNFGRAHAREFNRYYPKIIETKPE